MSAKRRGKAERIAQKPAWRRFGTWTMLAALGSLALALYVIERHRAHIGPVVGMLLTGWTTVARHAVSLVTIVLYFGVWFGLMAWPALDGRPWLVNMLAGFLLPVAVAGVGHIVWACLLGLPFALSVWGIRYGPPPMTSRDEYEHAVQMWWAIGVALGISASLPLYATLTSA